jgi:hypothetical protein
MPSHSSALAACYGCGPSKTTIVASSRTFLTPTLGFKFLLVFSWRSAPSISAIYPEDASDDSRMYRPASYRGLDEPQLGFKNDPAGVFN